MNLFTKEDVERCILTDEQARWFKREAKPILFKDDVTESEVLAWIKPSGAVFIERITLKPESPERTEGKE